MKVTTPQKLTGLVATAVFLLNGVSLPAIAQSTTTCSSGSIVVHVNGINTNGTSADTNLNALKAAIGLSQDADGKPISYDRVPNPDTRFFRDLSESALSWINGDSDNRGPLRNFAVQLVGAFLDGTFDVWYAVWALPNLLGEGLQEFLRLEAPGRLVSSYQRNQAVEATIRNRVQDEVLHGNKVVLVPHSQGNFLVNDALVGTTSSALPYSGVIGVAVPADHVGVDGMGVRDHVTRPGDLMMALIPGHLSANVNNDPLCLDTLGHSFVGCYLKPNTPSRTEVVNKVRNALTTLPLPTAGGGTGAISVTLRWGAQPDVDLHVFEPNGAHVYYAALTGPSGRLDLDDTNGFGPENYFVACSTVETGSYRVGVNYYSGSGPETAQIAVSAGTINRSFSQNLTTAIGSAGNASPIPVSTIDVTRPDNEFVFNIR